jgi:CMP-N-acetylneuraminic acid synthetase
MPIIAIIPSRGGSQRIPLKSLEKIGSKSLLERTVNTATESNLFDRIVVSTDSQRIADEAIRVGAEVPQLRTTASDNLSPVSDATVHTLQQLIEQDTQYENSIIYQLMPNCPFVSPSTLIDAFSKFHLDLSRSLISSVKADPIHWFAFMVEGNGGYTKVIDGVKLNSRTQDHPTMFVPSGCVWVATASYLLEHRNFYGNRYEFFEVPLIDGFDIDTLEQLEFARGMMNKS